MNWPERFGDEWEWIKRLGSSMHDPEQKKAFWETIKSKKELDPSYSVYVDFPREVHKDIPNTRAAELANFYAPLCIAALRGNNEVSPRTRDSIPASHDERERKFPLEKNSRGEEESKRCGEDDTTLPLFTDEAPE